MLSKLVPAIVGVLILLVHAQATVTQGGSEAAARSGLADEHEASNPAAVDEFHHLPDVLSHVSDTATGTGSTNAAKTSQEHDEATRYFYQALPGAVMPQALKRLVSPLSPAAVRELLDRIRAAGGLDDDDAGWSDSLWDATLAPALCAAAGLLCGAADADADAALAHTYSARGTDPASLFPEAQLLTGGNGMQVPASLFATQAAATAARRRCGSFLPRPLAKILERMVTRGADDLLRRFHVPRDSVMAAATRSSLYLCNAGAGAGVRAPEQAACAASLEDMADLARAALVPAGAGSLGRERDAAGEAVRVAVLSSSGSSSSDLNQQAVRAGNGDDDDDAAGEMLSVARAVEVEYVKAMVCRHLVAPFELQRCQVAPPATRVYVAKLESATFPGRGASAVALCYTDDALVSGPALNNLGTKAVPGPAARCQWLKPGHAFVFLATKRVPPMHV